VPVESFREASRAGGRRGLTIRAIGTSPTGARVRDSLLFPAMAPAAPQVGPAVHVVVPTHTTRHLAACIASVAVQRTLPATVVVTCDVDDPRIVGELESIWPEVVRTLHGQPSPTLMHVARPHQGRAMLNQVRNNGLRALDAAGRLRDRDIVLILDGDTLLAPDAVARHLELALQGFELVIPYRLNLGEKRSERITPEAILRSAESGGFQSLVGAADEQELEGRHRRYRRQLLLRRVLPAWAGVNKPHKPKVLGGHHAVSVRALRAVNGYDEEYVVYGFDDDDLSRRLHALRPPPRTSIAVKDILAYHLWHPTRAPQKPTQAPGYQRFAQEDLPVIAAHGWRTPLAQPTPAVRLISGVRPAIAAAG
jgi:hypothetical protein